MGLIYTSRQVDHSSSSSARLAKVIEPLEFVGGECSSNNWYYFVNDFDK